MINKKRENDEGDIIMNFDFPKGDDNDDDDASLIKFQDKLAKELKEKQLLRLKGGNDDDDNDDDTENFFGSVSHDGILDFNSSNFESEKNSELQKKFIEKVIENALNFNLTSIENSGDIGFFNQITISVLVNNELNTNHLIKTQSYVKGFDEDEIYVLCKVWYEKNTDESIYIWLFINRKLKNSANDFEKVINNCMCIGTVYNPIEFEEKTAKFVFEIFNFKPHLSYIKI